MNDYIQIEFPSITDEQKDIHIVELAETGFEGFEEPGTSLKAFVPLKDFDEASLERITGQQGPYLTKVSSKKQTGTQFGNLTFPRSS